MISVNEMVDEVEVLEDLHLMNCSDETVNGFVDGKTDKTKAEECEEYHRGDDDDEERRIFCRKSQ